MYCRVYCLVLSRASLTRGTVCPSGNLALGTMVTCVAYTDLCKEGLGLQHWCTHMHCQLAKAAAAATG